MKKRIIVTLYAVLGITSIMLVISIFKLYTEAEKVQRSIFVNEVLTAGDNIIDQIDAVIKKDTLALSNAILRHVETKSDTVDIVSVQHSRKFLLDSTDNKPIGIIKSIIYFKRNDSRIIENDTEYFSDTYRSLFPIINQPWEPSMRTPHPVLDNIDPDIVQLDTGTIRLLNKVYLQRIIRESLAEENIAARFDFALYNAFTTGFVIEPENTPREKILQSEYVFRLKYNEKVSSPHYIILYFPQERGIFLQRMSTIVGLILSFLVVTLIISFTALFSLYRQKKLSSVTNDFINNMTHEFKTPISTISLACEAMSDPGMNRNNALQEDYVHIINDENQRLKNMIDNILQIAQLKKGQIKMNIEWIDMHELIQKVADSIALQISSNHGTLTVSLDAKCHNILGDRSHLTNVVINLIENGIKYSPEYPEIMIKTLSDSKFFIISVTDRGIGISKHDMKDIFKNFYRVVQGNVHDVKGYGLGLGYVKKIVSLHSGLIKVHSEEGTGSTFIVYLPLKKNR